MPEPAAHRSLRHETMFSCMPLRLGVFLLSACTLATSLLYCRDRYGWHSAFRHFEGGYCPSSWIVVGAIQIGGVFAGYAGIVGTWYVNVSYVRIYNYWQLLRISGIALAYTFDLPLLRDCEGYVNNVGRMTEEYGWNELLYNAALRGQCTSERRLFLLCAFAWLVMLMYVTGRTSRYIELIGPAPSAQELRRKDLPSGAYYAHAMGERSHLNGDYGIQDHSPMAPGVLPQMQMLRGAPLHQLGDRAQFGSMQQML